MSVKRRTREQATNVRPEENSFVPMSITTLSNVRPCALWIVTAQASLSGSCSREHCLAEDDHVWQIGVIGTVPSGRAGSEYMSNCTVTAIGKSGGAVLIR